MPGRLSTHRVVSFHYIFCSQRITEEESVLGIGVWLAAQITSREFQHAHTNGHKKHHDIPVTLFSAAAPCRATFNAEPSRLAS